MGIASLDDVVNANRDKLFTDLKLCDTKLVIDGNSFCHQVSNRSGIDSLFAGDYPRYEEMINRYLDRFKSANITPTFIFDGLLDVETLKKAKSEQRLNDRLKDAKSIVSSTAKSDDGDITGATAKSNGGDGTWAKSIKPSLLPLFAQQVLVDILIARGIQIYRCAGEADAMAVGLANKLKAPLLSWDSDFFIFDLKCGYIPFDKIQLDKRDDTSHIQAKLYKLEKLLKCCPGVDRHLLPLFAFLCGNDFSKGPEYAEVRKFLMQRRREEAARAKYGGVSSIDLELPEPATKNQRNIINVLEWLCDKHDENAAIEDALKRLRWEKRGAIREAIDLSTKAYRRCESTNGDFDLTSITKRELADLHLPDWFFNDYIGGKMPAIFLLIRKHSELYLNALIQDFTKPSVYEYCRPIRLAVYRVLLKQTTNRVVHEYDRVDTQYGEPQRLIDYHPSVSFLPGLDEVQILTVGKCRQMFLDVLKISDDDSDIIGVFPDDLRLFASSFLFWYRSAGPEPSQARALLLCAARLSSNDHVLRQRLFAIDNSDEIEEYKKSEGASAISNLSNLHAFGQWQACYQACLWLDAVLRHPFGSTLPLHRLFHGRIAYILAKAESADLVDHLFEEAPTCFVDLWEYVNEAWQQVQ